jgi:hypothetical protein
VCAIDGTTPDVPDTPGHRARLGKQDNQYATAGYPQNTPNGGMRSGPHPYRIAEGINVLSRKENGDGI